MSALHQQRKQIARDIHDDLGASLTHIIQMSGQANNGPGEPQKAADQSERIRITAEQAVDQISEILWVTNPAYDTLEDLVMYVREYAATLFESSSINVHFDFPETVPVHQVSGAFRRHVLLLVKEALQNTLKHAAAKNVRIRLRQDNEVLHLSVSDDGRGLPVEEPNRSGNGLTNMRERVTELYGSFELLSRPGGGTEVRVSLPLELVS
jgi:signal transduction histidine kinase